MPNAALIAAALTDASVRIYQLTQAGVDVIRQPGTPGNLYGVPLETVAVTEAGPGGVSSMSYTIEDPSGNVTIPSSGTEVQFWDIASNHPEFRGFIQSVAVRPWPPTGRFLDVQCIGVEAQLDWTLVNSSFGGDTFGAICQLMAITSGLRDGIAAGGSEGTQDNPISGIIASRNVTTTVTLTNVTLRDAIVSLWAAISLDSDGSLFVTVDFYNGLRIWHNGTTNLRPDDYISLTVLDTSAGTFAGEGVSYDLTYGEIVRAVRVVGSSDFGQFGDGSGIRGPVAVVNDSSITTAAQAQAAAGAYMRDRRVGLRGSLVLTDFDEGGTAYRTGAYILLTDAQLGLTLTPLQIGQIDKTYEGNGKEDWTIYFGGPPPTASRAFRHLTRSTLS